ncbi:hypothetical protein ACLGL1_01035 [Peptococcus simiae]|uniref:hypothetical protein n=1 Tax=Peptococcus simiae TaxID=1643805 RepID=UPI00397FAA7E
MTFRPALFKELLRFNLIFTNTAVTDKLRQKHAAKLKERPEALSDLILRKNYLWPGITVFLIYSLLFAAVDFAALPMYLDFLVLMMTLVPIMQSFTAFYNIFYESADTTAYMPLPVYPQELFLARLAVVGLAGCAFMAPVVSFFALFFWRNDFGWPTLILGTILWSLVVFFVYTYLNILILQLLAKTAAFSRMNSQVLTVVNILGQLLAVVVLVFAIWTVQGVIDIGANGLVSSPGPLSGLILSRWHWPVLIGILLVFAGLAVLVYRGLAVHYYDTVFTVETARHGKKQAVRSDKVRQTADGSLRKILWQYNWRRLDDVTLVSQTLLSPILLPACLILPQVFLGNQLPAPFYEDPLMGILAGLLFGLGMALVTNATGVPLAGNIVSMDREDFSYICALPLDMGAYIREKWLFATVVSGLLASLVILLGSLALRLWVGILPALLVYWLLHAIISANWIIFDLRNLHLTWQSATDLLNRVPRALMVLGIFLGMGLVSAVVIGLGALAFFKGPLLGLALTLTFIILLALGLALMARVRRQAVRF